MRQAIIWTNADPIHWHIYEALGGDELMGTATSIATVIGQKTAAPPCGGFINYKPLCVCRELQTTMCFRYHFSIKMLPYPYRNVRYKDKMFLWLFYLYNEYLYLERWPLYWNGTHVFLKVLFAPGCPAVFTNTLILFSSFDYLSFICLFWPLFLVTVICYIVCRCYVKCRWDTEKKKRDVPVT